MNVDVVVLDIDGGERLVRCIESIRAQSIRPRRLIVWDNGSKIPSSERLSGLDAGCELVVARSEANLGFAEGANRAISLSSGDHVALVNNDVVLHAAWIERLSAALADDGRAAAVQSVIGSENGTIDGAGIDISAGTFRQIGHGLPPGAELPPLWGVSATAAIYRRAALDEVRAGGEFFRSSFFAYYEDVELCARLLERGWRMLRVGELLATHAGSASAQRLGSRALLLRVRNRYLVRRLHRGTGRYPALVREDVVRLVRAVAHLDARSAATIVFAVIGGLAGNEQ